MAELKIASSQPLPDETPLAIASSQPLPPDAPLGIVDSLKRYFTETQLFHPKEAAQGTADIVLSPKKTFGGYNQQQNELFNSAKDAFKRGDITEGVRHGISYLLNGIPGVGKRVDVAGNAAQEGDYGKATADTAAILTDTLLGPKAAKAGLEAATEPGVGTAIADAAKRTGASAVAGVKAAAPDVAAGSAKVALGGATDAVLRTTGVPSGYGTVSGTLAGAPQIVRGVKKGVAAARERFNSPREAALAQPETAITQPEPTPLPESRQIEAPKAIVTPPPADTSGVIKGYQPTILPNERAASPAAAIAPARPPAVDQALWERLSPDNQRELVQKLSNQPRPAATPAEAAALPSMPVAKPSPSVPRGTPPEAAPTADTWYRENVRGYDTYAKSANPEMQSALKGMKRDVVYEMVDSGKKVPAEVLSEFPDVKPSKPLSSAKATAPEVTSPITGRVVWDPARGHVMEGTNKAHQVETIPFAKPTPPAETFAATARATRAQNVAKLAPKLKELGIDPSTLPAVLNDVRKAAQLRTVATSLGIDLPKDLTKTIRDLTAALAKP